MEILKDLIRNFGLVELQWPSHLVYSIFEFHKIDVVVLVPPAAFVVVAVVAIVVAVNVVDVVAVNVVA